MPLTGPVPIRVLLLLAITAPLTAQSTRPGDAEALRAGFGAAVAVGDAEVMVGEPTNRFRAGIVYTWRRDGGGEWREGAVLASPDSSTGDRFGRALATDGATLVVGADPDRGRQAGAAYLFVKRASGTWRLQQALRPIDGGEKDGFGAAVLVRGDRAAIGAPRHGGGVGAVHLYRRIGTVWEASATLTPEDTAAVRDFGSALAWEGDHLLVGAPGSEHGAGAVIPFRWADGAWSAGARLGRSGEADTAAAMGSAVALIGEMAFAGAPGAASGSGAVVSFGYDTARAGWRAAGELTPFDGGRGGRFGASLAAGESELLVGAPSGRGPGVVHAYTITADGLGGVVAVRTPDAEVDRAFGGAVAMRGDIAAVGSAATAIGAGNALVLVRRDGEWTPATHLESPPESLPALTGPEVRCTAESAAGWDCHDVDLVSFLPVSAIGGVRGMRLNDLWGWTDSTTGREYIIIGRSDGTSFVDMSDAAHPRYLGDLPMTPGSHAAVWRDMKVYRDHAYITADGAGQHGVQVFDLGRLRGITAPRTFAADTVYTGIASAHNMVINEETGFGYVVGASGGGTTCGGGLHMLDLHEPGAPRFVGCYSDGVTGRRKTGYSHDAQCVVYRGPDPDYAGHEICIGANETALSLADVTDKSAPRGIATASYPNVAYAHQGWLSDDQRWFYSNDEIDEANGSEPNTRTLVWDLSDLDDPVLVKEYRATTTATDHNLYVRGRYMYQSNTGAGLRVIDIADPANPVEVGYFNTDREGTGGGTWSNYPYFASGVVPVTGGFAGIFLVRPRPAMVP
jgi:choice-of-anchor B domain-containing protein